MTTSEDKRRDLWHRSVQGRYGEMSLVAGYGITPNILLNTPPDRLGISGVEKYVLTCLYNRWGGLHPFEETTESISLATGIPPRSARRILGNLNDRGLITREYRSRKPTLYHITGIWRVLELIGGNVDAGEWKYKGLDALLGELKRCKPF